MRWMTGILGNPVMFISGLIILLLGSWLLRKAGLLCISTIALAAAVAAYRFLEEGGLVALWWGKWSFYLLAILLAWRAGEHPLIGWNAEVLSAVILGLFTAAALASWLHYPLGIVWVLLILGGVFPPLLSATLAAALLAVALGLETAGQVSLLLAGCILTARLRAGRFGRTYADPLIASGARVRPGTL